MLLLGILIVFGVLVLLDNLANKPCTVYGAQPMTGYDKQEMIQLAKQAVFIADQYGLKLWSPVLEEGVSGKGKLKADHTLDEKWDMDKEALNNSFCFVNLRADEKSFGCENEFGRHRYSEMQPSFLISPKHMSGYYSISTLQADGIFGDMHTCFRHIAANYGTLTQRQRFKVRIWARSGPGWAYRQLRRLFQ
jgi:hypothetical protein